MAVFAILIEQALTSRLSAQGGTWTALAPMPSSRQEVASAVLAGKMYVLGGYDGNGASTDTVEVYNPATDTWISAHPLPFPVNHSSAAVAAGKLYSFGAGGTQAFVYDPVSDSWSAVASMRLAHASTAAVGVLNDKIYVAGGTHGSASLRDMELYDPVTNSWSDLAPMSVPRNHCAGAFFAGRFYVVGGRGGNGAPNALEIYNPQTNTWSTGAPMPTGRSGIAAAAVNGELYVFGGEIPDLHGEVEVYNPATNTWRSLPNMPRPRHGIWASVIGDRIHIAGGGEIQGFGATGANDVFTVDRTATFANISTRLRVGTGDNVLIGGFIITGNASKRILVRVPGPSVGVPGALADPTLELYVGDQVAATNNNWQDASNAQEISDSSLAPLQAAEPAILMRVGPGFLTAVVRGVNGGTGVALVEVYDLEAGSESKFANISTRGLVQTGDNVLIGGLILTGTGPRRVVVRAVGPPGGGSVANPLMDPFLELRDGNGALLAANDNWRSDQEAEIIATTLAPGSDLESAIVRTLAPAPYTAIVRGVDGTTGVALVEAYALE